MKQFLYIVTGLPFAGKTTLTKKLVEQFGFEVASVDEMLEKGKFVVEKMSDDDWGIVYTQAFDKLKQLLKEGKTVIFDGGSLKRSERNTLKSIAESLAISCKLIYINTSKEEITSRRIKNLTTKERDQLENKTMEKALDMFEEPRNDEGPIIFDSSTSFDKWIKSNIEV